MKTIQRLFPAAAAAVVLTSLAPASALACACGCGVFGVGTSSLFPDGSTGRVWGEFDDLDQDHNRAGGHSAPADDNPDKDIKTDFFTLGGQYSFNRSWGVNVEIPYWRRSFRTTDDDTGEIVTHRHSHLGDIRLMGMYTGFSPDMSTGVSFGVKLPTGDDKYAGFDRDTSIGTGSTDLLLGAYHVGSLNKAGTVSYFAQANWDRPLSYRGGYKPGQDFNAAAGVVYTGFTSGKIGVSPMLQVVASHRDHDRGEAADPANSGYERVLLSPGVEISAGKTKLYGDVEVPIYQRYRGDQLASSVAFKLILSQAF